MKTLRIVPLLLACVLSSVGSVYAYHAGDGQFAARCLTITEGGRVPEIYNGCGATVEFLIGCTGNPVSSRTDRSYTRTGHGRGRIGSGQTQSLYIVANCPSTYEYAGCISPATPVWVYPIGSRDYSCWLGH